MPQRPLQQRSVYEIIRACQDEARQTRTGEVGFCFELFRRAIETQDNVAWEAIQQQYFRLILKWILERSPGLDAGEAEIAAQETLGKFWHTLTRQHMDVSARFDHVGALLSYLKQCAVTTMLDRQRRVQRIGRLQEKLQAATGDPWMAGPQEAALEQIARDERLRQVRQWISDQVNDPQELLVLRLSYEQEMTPAEIAASHPGEFPDARAVHRVKERILKRARRALAT